MIRTSINYPTKRWLVVLGLGLLAFAWGCSEEPQPPATSQLETYRSPLEAYCEVTVIGKGTFDLESEYLPRVVRCENGAADLEALKAQAVSARSYVYYRIETAGEIGDGQSDQVFGCDGDPGPDHYAAVEATEGEILRYKDINVAAFYVAGAVPTADSCVAVASDNDYSNTEHYVTYNQGNSGDNVEQTTLGWVDPSNDRNRGCKSQNGAHCLAERGWGYRDILRFYYGEDIQIVQAIGSCVEPTSCSPKIDGEITIIDDKDTCFVRGSCSSWHEATSGWEGNLVWTYGWDEEVDCSATWSFDFASTGEYEVEAYVPELDVPLTQRARYRVLHQGIETEVVVDQSQSGWASLGTYDFNEGPGQHVSLNDVTGDPYTGPDTSKRLIFDAIRLTRLSDPVDPDPGTDTGVDAGQDLGQDTGSPGQDAGVDLGGQDTTTDTTSPGQDSHDGTPDQNQGEDIPGLRTKSTSGCACDTRAEGAESFGGAGLLALTLGLFLAWRSRE